MTMHVEHSDGAAVFTLAGKIDEKSAAELKASFEGLNHQSLNQVIFDFGEVTRIGSAGLGKMLLFYKKLAMNKCKMTVRNPSDHIRQLMHELNLDDLFTIY